MKTNIPKIIFIVPYRDREKEKIHYSLYMTYIMEDYNEDDYAIYYSLQPDGLPFNRGATKNMGFMTIKHLYPNNYKDITFVFNDIDIIPAVKNTFNYETETGIVKHFYGFNFALGGLFSIKGGDFEKCNGFPNLWGWGIEDNEIQRRVKQHNLTIVRDEFYPLNSKEIIHLYDSPIRLISGDAPGNYIRKELRDNLNTIYNFKYKIEENINTSNKFNTNNQYIINILEFKTLEPPNIENLYIQNIHKNPKLRADTLKKQTSIKWNMNKFYNGNKQ